MNYAFTKIDFNRWNDSFFGEFLDNLNVGIAVVMADRRLTIVYCNKIMSGLIDINKPKFLESVHTDDSERFFDELFHASGDISAELRLNDGKKLTWVLCKGKSLLVNDGKCYQFAIVDINRRKQIETDLYIEHERSKTVIQQSDSIVFEYVYRNSSIVYSENFRRILDREFDKNDPGSYFFDPKFVHPEDAHKLNDIFGGIFSGHNYITDELRVRKGEDDYIWCRIKITTIYDAADKPHTTIGTLTDIDREKRESEALKFRAEHDLLTNLYNKATTKHLATEALLNKGQNKFVLMILDLDHFKEINDNFGHMFGDRVIKEASGVLKSIFRPNDIIGRFGGDEFVVFLGDMTETIVRIKAETILNRLRIKYTNDSKKTLGISSSVGIIMFDDLDYDAAYALADEQLYAAKEQGRDRYCLKIL